ncbi:MAG: SDR family NAD(P)-dependent oxidoreductase [Candidatus Binataceae bacterium]
MADLFSLKGKVALVTGASKEMGQEVAHALAEYGADVAVTARNAAQLETAAARIRQTGRKAVAIPADLTNIPELPSIVSRTVEALGRLDILVNVAGGGDYSNYGWALNMTEQMWDNMFVLNIKAPMFLCQAAAKVMKDSGGGSIVNISSGAGSGAAPRMSNYGAAKAGLDNLSATLAAEWARFRIRVNVIISGLVDTANARTSTFPTPEREAFFTKQMPLGRIGKPIDIAAAVLYLAGQGGEWVTGAKIVVNGGVGGLRPFG